MGTLLGNTPSRTSGILVILLLLLSAVPIRASDDISLAGNWRFRLDPQNVGEAQRWFSETLPGNIRLPGTTDDAGAGAPNTAKPDLGDLYRRNVFTGAAWYQRDIEIPQAWRGKRITLFLERVRWTSRVWLDGQPINTAQDSLIAPHTYDLGAAVPPGPHRLTLLVDNSVKHNLGRFVSALFGGTFGNVNGVVGRIALTATEPVWLDDVQAYPDVARRAARVKVRIGNLTGGPGQSNIAATAALTGASGKNAVRKTVPVTWSAAGGDAEFVLPLGDDARLWDEFSPNLYELTLTLDTPRSTRRLTFGLREIGTRGTRLTVNGRPIFLRGTLECSVFPLTGYPPTDVEWWRRVCRIVKSYGLNSLRFHSWCPPEAAFDAADLEGIYVQAEAPQANVQAGVDAARDTFIEQEMLRIVRTYGNHPSFCLMTLGNEYGGKDEVLTRWVDTLRKEDPRRLYSSASAAQRTANRQFTVAPVRGVRGEGTLHDFGEQIGKEDRPLISHEVGQWVVFPDFREMAKYTGIFAPRNFQIVRDDLQAKGMLDLAPRFFEATGRQSALLYKEEIEVLLRTPGHAGFQLLDLHDYPSQGTALVGLLDPFWDSKGLVKPAEHRRYCDATVPLARMAKRTFSSDETLSAAVDVAHFGPRDLSNAVAQWRLTDPGGRQIAAGALPAKTLPTGELTAVGTFVAPLDKCSAPCKLKLDVSLGGTQFSNSWDIWVYPRAMPATPTNVTICEDWDTARQALSAGKAVAFFPAKLKFAQSLPGRFTPVFWSPVWFPSQQPNTMGIVSDARHPAFAAFPSDGFSDWQWHDLQQNSVSLILDQTPHAFRPIAQVIDNFARNQKLGNIFEARVGNGRLLACTINLSDRLEQRPAARQLRTSLLAYVASAKFRPAQALPMETLDSLFSAPVFKSTLASLGAKVISCDSEDIANNHRASMAIDGDPETFWHTRWNPDDPMPHEMVIDMGREIAVKGVRYLPRQDMANGRIAQAEIYAGKTPDAWGAPVASPKWPNAAGVQQVAFAAPVTARYLKVKATREHLGQPFAAIAEFDVILDKP